jgi:hypothetical protein
VAGRPNLELGEIELELMQADVVTCTPHLSIPS